MIHQHKLILDLFCEFVKALSNPTVPIGTYSQVSSQIVHVVRDYGGQGEIREECEDAFSLELLLLIEFLEYGQVVLLAQILSDFIGQRALFQDFFLFHPSQLIFIVGVAHRSCGRSQPFFFLLQDGLLDNFCVSLNVRLDSTVHIGEDNFSL